MEGLPGHPLRRPRRRAGRGSPRVERQLSGEASSRRRLVLLRHGRTADNALGVFQGQLDTCLDDLGRAQAEAAAAVLAGAGVSRLLSSDLTRARTTAEAVTRTTGLPASVDPRLRELDLGAWQGLTSEQALERFPDEHETWRAGLDVRRGGGETYREAGERAVACLLEHLPEVPAGRTLLAVTHGGTARAALCLLLELPDASWGRLTGLGNCSWSVLVEHPRGWRLEQHGAAALPPAVALDGAAARAPVEAHARSL